MNAVGLKNFTTEVINSTEPVLVDFWAEFCAPCKALKPVLESVADEGVKVVTLDITQEEELTAHYGVSGIPTVILFKDGKPLSRVVGLKSKKDLLALVKNAV